MENVKKSRFEHLNTVGRTMQHDLKTDSPEHECDDEDFEDQVLMKRAGQFFNENIFSFFGCMLAGLVGLMFLPGSIQVLIVTHRSDNPLRAFVRYLSTINHTVSWYQKDKAKRMQSLKIVRKMHTDANKKAVSVHGPTAFISQFDMVTTQWAFVGPVFIMHDKIGIPSPSDEDLDALRHLMYVIGKHLGIEDEFNLCSGTLDDCKAYCHDILVNIIRPALVDVSNPQFGMATHLLGGMHMFNPFIDPDGFLQWTRRLFGSVTEKHPIKFKSSFSKFMFHVQCVIFDVLLHLTFFRNFIFLPAFNGLLNLNIFLGNYLREDIIKSNMDKYSL